MKRALRTIRVLLNRHYLGNSINACVVAIAATAAFYAFYFSVVIDIQAIFFAGATSVFLDNRWITASVVFDFLALGLLWRYWTIPRVLRFCLRAIHEVSLPFWFAWRVGRRALALSPLCALIVFAAVGVAVFRKLDRYNARPRHAPATIQNLSDDGLVLKAIRETPSLMGTSPCDQSSAPFIRTDGN
jgi:hypothetical protein